jgi:pSer/pThr/pTyr-binding forkhead associated (FHA) protein
MIRLRFRHITGSRATEIDEVQLDVLGELILGRASSVAVRFDPWQDAGVDRHHARIVWTGEEPDVFELSDLKSRHGTFINGRLITTPVRLTPGDIIQLGAEGPQVEVRWDVRKSTTLHLIG